MTIAVGMDCQRELDGVWYPAKIRRIDNAGITIEYVDDGNIEGPTHFDPWELRVFNENGVDITELDSDASSENMKTEEEAQEEEFDVPEENRQPKPIAYDMLDVRHKSNHNGVNNYNNIMGNSGSSGGGPPRRKHCHRQEQSRCGELQLRCVRRILNENVALHSIHPTSLRDDGAIELAASSSHQRNVVARLRPVKSLHSLSDALSSEVGNLRPMASRCQRCHRWTRWRCRRCNTTYYCSRKCQSQDWKVHCKVCEEVEFTPLHPNLVGRRKGHGGGTESRAAGAGERKYSWLKTPISSHRRIREDQSVEAREQVSWLLPATMVLFEELRTAPNDLDYSVSDLNETTTTHVNGLHGNNHAIGNLIPRPLASFSKFDSAKSTRAAAMRMHRQEEEEEEHGGNREEGIELTDLGKHYHGLGSQEPLASTQWPIDRYEEPLREQQQQQDSSMPFSNSGNNAASFSVQHFDSSGPFTAEETTAVSSSLRSKGSYDSFGSYQGPAQAGGQAYCLPVGLSAGKARLWDAASSGSLNAGQQSFENVKSCRSGADFTPSSSLKAADSSERDDNVWQTPPRKSLSKQGGGVGAGASRPSRPSLNPFVSESESGYDENQLIAATKNDLPEAEIIERILQLRMIVGSPDEEIRAAVVAFPNDVNQAAEWLFSHPGESPPPPPSPSNRLAAWAASSSSSSSSSSSLRTSKSFGPQLPRTRRPAPLIDLTAIDDEANENLEEGYDGSSSSNTRKPSFRSSDRQRANNPFDGGSPHSATANFDAGENIISKNSPPSELVEPSGCIRYVDGSELSTHPSTVQQFLPNQRDQSSPYDTSHWAWQSSLGKTPPRTSLQSPSNSHQVLSSRGDANRGFQDSAPGGDGPMMASNSFEANIRNACYPILLYQGVESVHQRTCCLIMTQIANDRLSSRLLLITRQPPVLLPEYFRHQSPHRFYQPSSSELLAAKWPETFVHILNLAHDQAEALYSSCGLEKSSLFDFSSHMRKARAIMSSLRPAVKVLGRVAGSQNLELCLRYQLVSLAGDEIFSESECPECSITDPIGNSFELSHPSTVFNERMQQQCPPPKLTPPALTKEKLLHRSNPGMTDQFSSSSLDADSIRTAAANNRVHFDDLSFVRPIGSSDFVPVEQDTFTREQVATLMEAFGASEEQAEDALRRSFGDLDTAANWLLS